MQSVNNFVSLILGRKRQEMGSWQSGSLDIIFINKMKGQKAFNL